MKKLILFATLFAVGVSCYSLNSFADSQCHIYEFSYLSVPGKNHYLHHIRTDNYEHPRSFDINASNPLMKNIPADEMSGFRLMMSDLNGKPLATCFYGVHGDVMANDNNTVSCPKLMPQNVPGEDFVCRFSLPSG